MRMTPQYFHHHPASCVPFCELSLVLVVFIGARVVQGSGVGSAGCVVSCVLGGCKLTATEHARHGRYGCLIRRRLRSEQCWVPC